MYAYYNEIDPFAVAWLRALIAAGCIADGLVDARPIQEVQPDDLTDFTQCHFFAGIGGWSHALRLAGWPDDRPIWTGSCPCQPFSQAGKRQGTADSRHLWPDFARLIRKCRPSVVAGEQVASPDGLRWFDLVSTDLEAADYAVGAVDLCAAGVGAPHVRQRLYWVGHAESGGRGLSVRKRRPHENQLESSGASEVGGMADCDDSGLLQRSRTNPERANGGKSGRSLESSSITRGFWSPTDWLYCRDNTFRPVEPGTFPLAHGVPARVGRLRGYGNAIVPQVAATFIQAFCETVR